MEVFYSENTFRIRCKVNWPVYMPYAFPAFLSYLRTLQLEASIPRVGLHYSEHNFHTALAVWRNMCGYLANARVALDTVTFSFIGINSVEKAERLLIEASSLAPFKEVRFVAEFFDNEKNITENRLYYSGPLVLPSYAQVSEHGLVELGLGFSGVWLEEDLVNTPPEEFTRATKVLFVSYGYKFLRGPPLPTEISFNFAKLPFELKSIILSHTGLIRDSSRQPYIPLTRTIARDDRAMECCGQCGGHHYLVHDFRNIYFYDRDFATYSSTCAYGGPRSSALFATSSEVREEVLNVYYGRNNFAVTGPEASAIIRRIRSAPKEHLRRVKRLRIVLEDVLGCLPRIRSDDDNTRREYDDAVPEILEFWENFSKILLELHTSFEPSSLNVEFLVGGYPEEWWGWDDALYIQEVKERKTILERLCAMVSGCPFGEVAASVSIDGLLDLWSPVGEQNPPLEHLEQLNSSL